MHTVQCKGVADFVQVDVLVLLAQALNEVLLTNALAPVTTGTTLEVIAEPQALVCRVVSPSILTDLIGRKRATYRSDGQHQPRRHCSHHPGGRIVHT